MNKARSTAPTRLIFEMPTAVLEHIQKLADRAHAGDKAATVRHALATYDMLIEHRDSGGGIVLRDEDGTERPLTLIEF
ncbi:MULTISPECIES: hypothetical protein [Burkholderia]|uniref:Uncharacterized protein n=2 Tax=Burkholderia cepacia complex TaxID=87882 RepID=A0AAP1V829_9BURK|nr:MULTISPECIES: hypothetical protein [Burkholderia]MBK1902259.1 hypothetical protein [Burkholderia contaminans]MBK1910542.1 hypothetical protein [Burkholderia contaminans]MBK1924001.1 hypothetical protein [Burkholderia contaminans]MBK1932213.1 hypothetical protein [Burkholderia contaminans]MBK1939462.1 hypothetical protein [Burkholderia contaminans]